MTAVADILASVCLLGGALLCVAAGIGLLRFPDVVSRLHALAKPQVLGVLLILLGIGLRLRTWADIPTLVLIGLFQLATVPIAAHMVSRASYRSHVYRSELLVDELASTEPPDQ
jgi:multicomponent Na+:H+ antiporter subunit G